MRVLLIIPVIAALLTTGCAVGPNYHRPAIQTPPAFRGAPDGTPAVDSIADVKWPSVFNDPQLTTLITTALTDNYDVRIAAARVLQARAQFAIQRSFLYPTVLGSANNTAQRGSSVGSIVFLPRGVNLDVDYYSTGLNFNWELDVWGRLRRLNEAARAQYLATEEGRRAVVTTLVGDLTNNYLYLREADSELDIGRRALETAQRSLDLTNIRRQGGVATSLDVRQAEQFLFTATAQIAASQRQIEQFENLLSLLAAKNPGPIVRGKAVTDFFAPPTIPPGLPSTLLERRPDIRQAEQQLIAANANIGAAKAQYFPQITLTGLLGSQSRALTNLFTRDAQNFSITPGATITRNQSIQPCAKSLTLWSLTTAPRNSVRRKNCSWLLLSIRSASQTCAIAAVLTATCKCWMPSAASSPASSIWPASAVTS